MVKLSDLKPHPNNPRTITKEAQDALKSSIEELSEMMEVRPIAYDEEGIVWGGNQRLDQLIALGYTEIPKSWTYKMTGWTLAKKKAFAIKDNVAVGKWDTEKAIDEYWKDYTLEYGDDELKELFAHLESVEHTEEQILLDDDFDDDIDAIQTDIVLGDLIEIGQHRLLCGDSTSKASVDYLMNSNKADIAIQSPPYNVGRTPNGNQKKYVTDTDNKNTNEYLSLLNSTTIHAIENSVFAFINIQSVAGNKKIIIDYLAEQKEYFCDYIIWDKLQAEPATGENILNSRFEFVYVFGHSAKRRIGVKKFRGNLDNIIFIKSRQDKEFSKHHKATFPIAFSAYFINNFSTQSCLDLFCGTGTTIVAAEQIGVKCYAMDNEPKYCQITINRMKNLFPDLIIKKNGVEI